MKSMSKSLKRVQAALSEAGVAVQIIETPASARTAAEAATAAGVVLDQIVKSILLAGESGKLYLFLTAGGQQVDLAKAAALAGEPLGRADADVVRKVTGFAIGGVAPIGHLTPLPLWMDPHLMGFDQVWAAAGTPHHIFAVAPATLQTLTQAVIAPFTIAH
jgi:prolyl-tRNA editing enzyme YbaK/EbsC (Cys-tRNA(Pro) deacylase)